MSDEAAFIRNIAESPADDFARLVFADWLDERNDPLGEFIRAQIALEVLYEPRSDLVGELQREHSLQDGSPLETRSAELLREHGEHWLGTAATLTKPREMHFRPEFRRGFVAAAQIGLSALTRQGGLIRSACPTLQKFIVFGSLGRGTELAGCSALAGMSELLIAGWLDAADARRLAKSPHLRDLRSLTFWIAPEQDQDVARFIADLPKLRELKVVQMCGGHGMPDPSALDEEADAFVELVGEKRPDCVIRLERPFARRFPLDGVHIGYGLFAGNLPDGQCVLIEESAPHSTIMYFDENGYFQEEEPLMRTIEDSGYRAGPIFVREFVSHLSGVAVTCWGTHEEEIESPGTTDPEEGEEIGASLYWWWSTKQFSLPFGNDYWADGRGRIHTS